MINPEPNETTENSSEENVYSEDVKHLVEGVFGAGALEMLGDDYELHEEAQLEGLEQALAGIDRQYSDTDSTLNQSYTARQRRRSVERFVLFELAGQVFAVSIQNVLEVQRPPRITSLPNVPDWIQGICNLRGEIVSVVDLRQFLELPQVDENRMQKLVVAHSAEQEICAGFLVDHLIGIRAFEKNAMQHAPLAFPDPLQQYAQAFINIDNEIAVQLNLQQIFESEKMLQFQGVREES